jgi:hypothetical protein
MKNILKIGIAIALVSSVTAVSAQYRYPYPRYDRYRPMNDRFGGDNDQNQYNVYRNSNSNLWLMLDYSISQPLGSFHDYAGKTSFIGWNASLLYQFNPKFAAGLGFGYHDYYQKIPRMVYQDKTTAISAVQTHTLQLIPVQPTAIFTPNGGKGGIQPYVGLGIGVADVNYQKYWGEFVDKKNKIGFSVSPLAGIQIPIGKSAPVKVNVGVKYNYDTFKYNEINNISTIEGNVGISFRL